MSLWQIIFRGIVIRYQLFIATLFLIATVTSGFCRCLLSYRDLWRYRYRYFEFLWCIKNKISINWIQICTWYKSSTINWNLKSCNFFSNSFSFKNPELWWCSRLHEKSLDIERTTNFIFLYHFFSWVYRRNRLDVNRLWCLLTTFLWR